LLLDRDAFHVVELEAGAHPVEQIGVLGWC
jgi:hypothetical protein